MAERDGNKVNDPPASADEAMKARVITDFETGAEPDVLFYFNGNDSNSFVEAGKVFPLRRSVKNIRTISQYE